MPGGLSEPRATARRVVREALADGAETKTVSRAALQDVVTMAVRESFKTVVKEAVREVQADAGAQSEQRRSRDALCLGLGVALGYVAARGRSSIGEEEPTTETEKPIEIEPEQQ